MSTVPCIAGPRIPVASVVGLVDEGMPAKAVLAEYPQLTREDVWAALRYGR